MELRHLRYFVAVADAGHVGRAAVALRIAQQPLSRQIRDLERELGVALFVRHPRGMALTAAGAEFLAHARETLAAAARAVEHLRRLGAGRPEVRVGGVDYGRGQALLRAAAGEFRARYPHARLEVDPAPYAAHPSLVADGRLDVGFYSGCPPSDNPATGGVCAELLFADHIGLALLPAGEMPGGTDEPLGPAALSAYPLLTIPRAAHVAEVDDTVGRLHAAGWRGRLAPEAERPATVLAMVACGVGWACAPASVAGHAPPGTQARPLADGTGTPYDLHILTRDAGGDDPLAAAFLGCLRAARDAAGSGTAHGASPGAAAAPPG